MQKLPSERAKEAKEKKNIVAKQVEQNREAFNRLFQTEDGKIIFKWLYDRCGFSLPSAVVTKDGLELNSIIYNESRRNLYLDLRDYIHKDLLSELEKKESEY